MGKEEVAAAGNGGVPVKYGFSVKEDAVMGKATALLQRVFSPSRFDAIVAFAEKIGHWAIYAAMVLGLVFAIVTAIRIPDFELLFRAIILILGVGFMQYVAFKIFRFNTVMLAATREKTGAAVIFELLALAGIVGGLLLLARDLPLVFKFGIAPLGNILVRFITVEAIGIIALNFHRLNQEEDRTVGPGESALTLLAFIGKAALPLARIIFGLFAVLTFIGILRATIKVCGKVSFWEGVNIGFGSVSAIMIAVAVPVAATLFYLALRLLVELMQAVLQRNDRC
ncbi:MAG: hypothetical protein PHQ27_05895 [Victivallales bacterium]|nr:hypothetical protein [Victivallales bacterium]